MPKKIKTYKNYKELSSAFKSGELDPKRYFMMLDKGGRENSLCYRPHDDESEAEADLRSEECREIFKGGDNDIEELYEALGIPCEWC